MATSEQLLQQILVQLQTSEKNARPQVLGSAVLKSGSPNVRLNSNYFYSIALYYSGTNGTGNTNVYVDLITEQTQNPGILVMNSAVAYKYKIKGIRTDEIRVDPTNLGTDSIIVAFIGYDKQEAVDVSN